MSRPERVDEDARLGEEGSWASGFRSQMDEVTKKSFSGREGSIREVTESA